MRRERPAPIWINMTPPTSAPAPAPAALPERPKTSSGAKTPESVAPKKQASNVVTNEEPLVGIGSKFLRSAAPSAESAASKAPQVTKSVAPPVVEVLKLNSSDHEDESAGSVVGSLDCMLHKWCHKV